MTNLYFQVASFFYMIMIMVLFFSKKKISSFETKIFSILSIINVIGIILDLIIIFLSYVTPGVLILYILNKIYLIYIFIWVILFYIYIFDISIKNENIKRKNKKYQCISAIVGSTVICLLPIYLFNENNIMYTYGPSVTILYTFVLVYFIFIAILCIVNRKNLLTKKYSPVISLIILCGIGLIVRLLDKSILLTTTIITYINILMYHTIENPDIRMIEKLNIAKDEAEKANNAKTDFLSSMSHEIRTPLNAIVGFSDCIENASTLEEAKENAKDVVSAAGTLLEIVNGVLDISKIEAGKLEIVNSSYDSYKLFNNCARLVKPRMDEKALDFQIEIAPDIPKTLYGDYANLKKIITNVLSNASKYTEKGFVKYTVNCVKNNNICRIVISVEDSGRGIKKENIDKLFNKFERLEEDKNTTIEGTGLGLAITKKLLELMGGRIVVQSVYGSGSKFTIVVDQAIILEKYNNSEVISKNKIKENIDISNKKILIVDDNKLNLKVATKIINSLYQVDIDTVESGFDCIYKIESGAKYDLILMDDMMPKMSGIETLQKLKEFDNFNIPVVALTANAIAGMREKYLSNGFNEYLAKPIDKREFVEVINNIFQNSIENNNTVNNDMIVNQADFGTLPKELFEFGTSQAITNGNSNT